MDYYYFIFKVFLRKFLKIILTCILLFCDKKNY